MTYGVIIVLTCVNVLEKIFIENSKFRSRLLKTTVTVVFIYVLNWGVFQILGIRVFCIYYYPRGIPAPIFGLTAIGYLAFILVVFEGISKTKLFTTIRRLVVKLTIKMSGDSSHKIIGWILLIINIIWTIRSAQFLYFYHCSTGILYMFMIPDWILVLNVIIGMIGIYIGLRMIKKKLVIGIWGMIDLALLIVGGVVEYYWGFY